MNHRDSARDIGEGSLEAHFQPQYTVAGELAGVEALARWRTVSGELLLPDDFLPAIQRAGLSRVLAQRMVDQAAYLAVCWRAKNGSTLPVAVNVDPGTIISSSFLAYLEMAVRRDRISPDVLVIEVLEESMDGQARELTSRLRRFRRRGYRISIDDFGTGGAGLQRLLDVPADEVKIPGCFVKGVGTDCRKAAVVEGMVAMAERMGMTVVLEGVERAEDMEWAARLRAQIRMQGFLLARPMPMDQLIRSKGAVNGGARLGRDMSIGFQGRHASQVTTPFGSTM
ncbi:EAL domain-containing protein [Dyella amyloliquefaciens]|uniref:EAL domain-containing protein n=1 Tax=Dyella amyloliquefaciens TaxID=1770545 RepID=UPI00102E2402|nr:EAL domain-containing protein [Dyella amyloliquefaciens]